MVPDMCSEAGVDGIKSIIVYELLEPRHCSKLAFLRNLYNSGLVTVHWTHYTCLKGFQKSS